MKVLVLDQCGYTYEMAGRARTHEKWLEVMRFGLTALIGQQDIVTELVYEEACKLAKVSDMQPWQEVARIFEELGLKMVLDDDDVE